MMGRVFSRALVLVLAAAFCATPLFAATGEYRAVVLSDNPIAYYPLDETTGTVAADASGNGKHGTYNNVFIGNAGALGSTNTNHAAAFDGASSYIQLPGTWGGGSAVTVEAWVHVDNPNGTQAIVAATTTDFVRLQAGGFCELYLDNTQQNLSSVPDSPAAWHHVVLVVTSGGSKLYVDGVQTGSNATNFTSIDVASDVRIGVGASATFLNGAVDEVAIYNTALSPARIAAHYAAQPDGPIETIASGTWNSPSTWANGYVPDADTDAQINGSHTVTMDVPSMTVNKLTVLGTLDVSSFGITVTSDLTVAGTIDGTAALTLAGSTTHLYGLGTINSPVSFSSGNRQIPAGESPTLTNTVDVTGIVFNSGEATLTHSSGLGGSGTWNQGSTGTLHVEGPITVTSFSAAAAGNLVDYTGSPSAVRPTTYHNLSGTGALETRYLDGAITINGNLTVEGYFEDSGFQITGPGTSGTLLMNALSVLRIGTNSGFHPTNGTFLPGFQSYALDPTSTITYDARANQTIANIAYQNVAVTAYGMPAVNVTKTLSGNTVINGTLEVNEISSSVVLDIGSSTLTIEGSLIGAGEITKAAGGLVILKGDNNAFSGAIKPTYDITFAGGNAQNVRGTLYDALTINKSAGTATLTGPATATLLNLAAGTLYDAGFTLASNGTVTLGANTTLRIAATMPAGTHITDPSSTVIFEADGPQIIDITPIYGHLIVTTGASASTKTPSGVAPATLNAASLAIVNGPGLATLDLSSRGAVVTGDVTGNGELLLNIGALEIGGDFIHTGPFDGTGSVSYVGSGAQIVRGTAYTDLTIDKPSGTATLAGNVSVADELFITDGTLNLGSYALDSQDVVLIDTPGTLELNTGILKIAAYLIIDGAFNGGTTGELWITASSWPAELSGASTAAISLHSLRVTNAAGMELDEFAGFDLTVTNLVDLSGGGNIKIETSRKLTVASTGSIVRTAGAVQGLLAIQIPAGQTRRFETATYLSNTYSPMEITSTNAATINVLVSDTSATQKVDRLWTLSGDPSTLDIKYEWAYTGYTGDTRWFVPARFAAGNWTFPAGYVEMSGAPNYFALIEGVSAYDGDWTAGNAQFLGETVPSIGSFTPAIGASGTAVTLYGSNFTGTTAVAFNGVNDPGFSQTTDNELYVTVPAGATTGTISVTNASGTGSSFNNFTVAVPSTISTAQAGNWSSPATWQGGVVPNDWDNAVVNHNVTLTANAIINDVQLNANLSGSYSLDVFGTMTWNSGLISSNLVVAGGATLDVATAATHEVSGGTLTNQDTLNINGGDLTLSNGAGLVNNGTININGDFDIVWNAAGATPAIDNNDDGSILKTAGAGTAALGGGADLNNIGVIRSQSGTLDINSDITTVGLALGDARTGGRGLTVNSAVSQSFEVANGATLQFTAGATFQTGTGFTGSGTILILSAVEFKGNISASATSFAIDANATITWTSATFSGTLTWKQGNFTGVLTNDVGSVINAAASAGTRKLDALTLTNQGTFNLASAAVDLTNGAWITNQSGANINLQGDYNLAWDNAGSLATIQNDGTITKTAGPGTSSLGGGASFSSSDTLRADTGTLRVSSPGTIAGAAVAANPGTTVEFNSAPSFADGMTFTGDGTVLINSAADFTGNIYQTANLCRIDTTGTITFAAVTFNGHLEWKDGTFTGDTLIVNGGSVWNVVAGPGTPVIDSLAVTNNGVFNLAGNSVALAKAASFTNQLTLDIQGDYDFRWDGSGGAPAINNNSMIKKSAGTGTTVLGNSASITHAGAIQADTGTLSISSAISGAGSYTANTGSTIAFPSTASFSTGTIFGGLGTIDINSNATFSGTITAGLGTTMIRGAANTITFNGVTWSGPLTWKEATVSGTGFTIASGWTLTVDAGTGTAKLDAGTITLNGDAVINDDLGLRNGAAFMVASGGTVSIGGDYTFGYDGTGALPTVGLSGTFKKTAGTGTTSMTCGGVCTNTATGTIGATSGTLALTSGLTNNGTIAFEILGPTPLVSFGRIAVSGGALTLAGTATATVDPGYTPDGGTAFQVMTFTSKSGDFVTKNYTFAGVRTLADTYTAGDLTLTASGPTISSITPTSGSTAGGTAVTINGSGFSGTTAGENFTGTVSFGGNSATPVLWQSATQLTATSPANVAGTVNVTVTNANTESHTLASAYTYIAGNPPTVSGLSVTTGTPNGGTYVEITGTNLDTVTQVQFGASNATILSAAASLLKVRTPPGGGTVNLTVTNPDGTNASINAFTYTAPGCDTGASGVVSWYRMEGDTTDGAGANDGAPVGTASFTSAKVGQGLVLDSDDDGVTINHTTQLDAGAAGFTVEFWMQGIKNQPGAQFLVVDKSHGFVDSKGWAMQGFGATGVLHFVVGRGGPGTVDFGDVATSDVLDGQLHHIAGVWDGTNITVYVDGLQQASAPLGGTPSNNTRPVNVGYSWGGGTPQRFFRGTVDELTIHNRALSPGEILAVYDADDAGKCYPAAPTVLSISPASGSTAGNTGVTILGSSMSGASVTIGNPISIGTNTQSQITGTTVATAAGTYNVDVTNAAGTGSLANGFAFATPQAVTSVANGNWSNPAVWSNNAVPSSFDSVTVDGETVTIDANFTVANLDLTAGTLAGPGTLTVTDSFDWTGGNLGDTGGVRSNLSLGATSVNTISGSANRTLDCHLNNAGSLTFTATGAINHYAGTFTNSGTLALQSDVSWVQTSGGSFTNTGTLTKTIATGGSFGVPFTNTGTLNFGSGTTTFAGFSNSNAVNVTAGTLSFTAASTNAGSFAISSGAVVVLSSGAMTFNTGASFSGAGTFRINGGTLSMSAAASGTNLDFDSGVLNGAGLLTISDSFDWTGGSLGDTGGVRSNVTLDPASVNTISGAANRILDCHLTNSGSLTFTATGQIQHYAGTVTNSGTWALQSNANWIQTSGGSFTNTATFNKTIATAGTFGVPFTNSGTLNLGSGTTTFSSTFSNSNTVNVTAGILALTSGGTNSGSFAISSGAEVVLFAGTMTFNTGASFSGAGTLRVAGGTLSMIGAATGTNLDLDSGMLADGGLLTITGSFDWTGGSLGAGGGVRSNLTLDGSSSSTISGTANRLLDCHLTVAGSLTFTATGAINHYAGTVTNTGTFAIQSDGSWLQTNGGAFTNSGTLTKSVTTGTTTFGVPMNTSGGTIDVASGTLALNAAVTTNGTSHLKFGIGGLTAGTGFGNLTVAGALTLNGTLTAYITGVYVPQGGSQHQVLAFGSTAGAFATKNLTFGGTRSFTDSYTATAMTLTASGPTITSVVPSNGSEFGGTTVVITGTGFTNPSTVTFGGTAAGSVTFDSATQLTVVTAASAPGTVDVIVTDSGAQPGTLVNGFTFDATPAPAVTAIRPNTGNVAGGTTVYIDGTGLDTVSSVVFDATQAVIVNQTATLLEVTAPAHAAGVVTVTVINPAGSANGSFTYNDVWDVARDFNRSLNPTGPWSYGHTPTRGGAFTLFTTTAQPSGFDQWDVSGSIPTVVHNPTSASITHAGDVIIAAGTFGLHPGTPQHAVTRWTAPAAGAYEISGSFTGIDQSPTTTDVAVLVGGTQRFTAIISAYNAPQAFTLRRNLALGEVVEFTVSENGSSTNDATGLSATVTPLLGPVVTVTSVSPALGSPAGGQSVTITGTNFHTGAGVTFGGVSATSIVVVSATTITAVTPAHAAGTVDVVVTHPDSADATLTNGYVYSGDPHWLNPVSGNWNTAANWSTGAVPTSVQTAYIDAAGTYTVTVTGTSQTVTAVHISSNATLSLSGADLTITGPSSNASTSTLAVAGGSLIMASGSSFSNGGTVAMTGGAIRTPPGSGAVFTNTGTINFLGDVGFDAQASFGSGGTLNSSGTINKSAGTGTSAINGNWALNNSGTVSVTTGTLQVQGAGGTSSGTITATSPGTFDVGGGTLSATAGSIAGTGTFRSSAGTATISGGTFTPARVAISGGTLVLNVAGTTDLLNVGPSGILDGSAGLTLIGPSLLHTWAGGSLSAPLTINAGNALAISALMVFQAGASITNSGTIDINGGPVLSEPAIGATFLNTNTLNINTDISFGASSSFGLGTTINNTGTINKTGGTGTTGFDVNWGFNNTGTVNIAAGILRFEATGNTNTGTINLSPGSFEIGAGTFAHTAGSIAGTGAFRNTNTGVSTITSTLAPGAINLSGGTLDLDVAVSTALLNMSGGALTGSGGLTVVGPSAAHTISGGDLHTALTLNASNTLTSTGSFSFQTGAFFTNNGTIDMNGGSWFSPPAIGATFLNAGTLNLNADTFFSASGSFGAGTTFNNTGTINKTGGSGSTPIDTNWVFNNSGTLTISAGRIRFEATGDINTGTINLSAASASMEVNGGTFAHNSGSISGPGSFRMGGGSASIASTYSPADTTVFGGTLNLDTAATTTTLNVSNGTVAGTGALTAGSMNWSGGTLAGPTAGVTDTVTVTGTLTMNGATEKILNGRALHLNGNTIWTAGNLRLFGGTPTGSDFVIAAGALADIQGNGAVLYSGTGGAAVTIAAGGTLRKSGLTGASSIDPSITLNHSGLLDITAGTVTTSGAAYVPTASADLQIGIGGLTGGANYGIFTISGTANLAGDLTAVLTNGFVPATNDTFTIVNYGSAPSDFTNKFLTYAGGSFSYAKNATNIVLTADSSAAVSISKTAPANVAGNEVFTYTIDVTVTGTNPATTVSVTDAMQAGMVPSNISAPSFSCGGTATLTCTAASLAVGTHTITFDVTAPSTPQAISNVANVSAANDSTPGDNSSTAITNVGAPQANLEITKLSHASVTVGGAVNWTISVTNNGPSPASAVTVTDTVPEQETVGTPAPSTGSCNVTGNVVTCNFGSLAVGASVNVTIPVTVNEAGTHTNSASVVATESDPDTLDNTAQGSVVVTGGNTLVVRNSNSSGNGSLSQALLDADGGLCASPCTITFNITTLTPIAGPLPIADVLNLTIDGTTQPGYNPTARVPLIEIDGSSANPGASGLNVDGDNHVIRGLAIYGFAGPGAAAINIIGGSHTFEANWIGVKPDGTPAPNTQGILVNSGANVIGSADPSLGNVIANNGIGIALNFGTGTHVLGNSIHDNTGLAIDHDGDGVVEILDAGDADTGPNNHQNAPVISLVEITPADLDVTFSVDSNSVLTTNSIRVEVFKADASGEPQEFLGAGCFAGRTLTNQLINVPFGTVVGGDNIVATATSFTDGACATVNDGTSEVSASTAATNCVPPPVTITGSNNVCAGGSVVLDAGSHATYLWTPGNFTSQTINVAPASTTTYTVTVTDASGCSNSMTHMVTVNTPAAVSVTGPASVCAGNSVTLTATGGFTSYLWQPGNLTGPSINVTPTGTTTYTVAATDANGCTSNTSHTVTVNTPAAATITASGPTTFCTGGSVTLTASAGSTYVWSPNGETTPSITVSAGGTYGVTVTDANGCASTAPPVTVTVNTAPPVGITGPASTCSGNSVTLNATGGFTSYLWQPGNLTGPSVNVTPAANTTYTVTATDANGCTSTSTHTVTIDTAAPVSITGPADTCAGNAVTLNASGTFTSYLWQPGNLTGPSINVSPAATTTYTVTATDANGCTSSAAHVVAVNTPPAATATASGPTTFCAGGNVVLTASAGASYQWLPNGETGAEVTVTTSGTYSVIVTDANGCTSTSNSVNVTVNPVPTVTITGPTATCDTAAVTLDAGTGFTSYLWQPGNFTTQTITVSPSSTTTYTVTVSNGSCNATDTHQVNVTANPAATITAPTQICSNTTGHPASVGTQPGATYAWSITNGTITSATNTPSITFDPAGLGAVQLNVTVTTGSCTATGSTTVNVVNGPVAPVITAPTSVPASSSGHTASVTPQAGAAYFWTIDGGTFAGSTSGPSVTFNSEVTSPITISVIVNVNGCTASASTTVAVDNVPPPANEADLSVTKSAPAGAVAGTTFTYSINVSNAGPATANATVIDTIPAGLTVLSVNGGSFDCTTAGSHVGCTGTSFVGGSDTISITVRAPAQATTVTNTVTVNAAIDDPNTANNTDSVSTTINVAPPTCPGSAPSLLSPANGANVSSPVALSWTAVNSASGYDVWVDTDGLLTLAGSTNGTSLSVSVGSGVTTWYVVAHGGNGCASVTSESRTFTVAPSSTCGNNGKPQVTSPQPNANAGSPLTISWTPVAQAIGYRVWISVDGTAQQDVGSTNGPLSLTVNVPPGAINVHVDALFNACPPSSSDPVSFNVATPDPCANRGAAALLSPANNSQVNSSSVELRWSAPAGSTLPEYRVWASVDGAPPAVIGTTNETSLREVFERGQVIWFVEVLYPGCASTESPRFNFNIPARNQCDNTRPSLIAPNGSTVSNGSVTFSWSGVPDAVAYEVWLALGNESATLVGTTAAGVTTFDYSVPPGNLTWHVRALIDRCPARESTLGRFTYVPPASCANNDRPIAISPTGTAPLTSPADFSWSASTGATRYELYVHRATQPPALVASTTEAHADDVALAAGSYRWFVRAFFNDCSPLDSGDEPVNITAPPAACAILVPPVVSAPGQISSGIPFLLQWTPVAGASSYQLQIASDESFTGAEVISTTATEQEVVRTNNGASPIAVYARVRAIDSRCTPSPSITPYGPVSAVFVLPQQGSEGAATLAGADPITYTINLGPQFAGQSFTAVPTQTWLSVSPASGIVPAGGMNLIVTADSSALGVGTSLGSVNVTLSDGSASRVKSAGFTTVTTPISVSLVTPVTPAPKNTPPPDALVIPAVANADGIRSHFQSDVRVSNTSAQLLKYQLTYIPTGDAGISSGRQTTFSIEPGRTVALDDILRSWFGTGSANSTGTLEVRPLTQTTTNTSSAIVGALANLSTFASSRTFNITANGTFGQHIPAIPFANFIGKSANSFAPSVLSLQQIAQSSKYRTNLGLVEASGESASLLVKVFGSDGSRLTDFPVLLNGGQHLQLNGVLAQKGITSLNDGRIEVEVVSGNGKITAYASVLDNQTSDPLLVSPITLGAAGNSKWVVPGVADLNNGTANWQTDMRVFNAGATDVPATLSFYSQNGGAAKTSQITIPAGQVMTFDKALSSVFGAANDGGAVHITTAADARLIATARTYNQTSQGTYGQYIPAVTPLEAAAMGTRPLQLLQVEESDRFRSNIGLAEVTGNPVKVEISVIPPDAKFTATIAVDLAPNEFRQINSLLKSVGLTSTFNARVTVRVIDGNGRVAAYASVIDMKTQDPTYVPAQ